MTKQAQTMTVVNKRKNQGSNRHPNTVYCGRGSALGNPWLIKGSDTRDVVCDRYDRALTEAVVADDLNDEAKAQILEIARLAQTPEGVVLECYCAPLRCHCDSIKNIIDKYTKP